MFFFRVRAHACIQFRYLYPHLHFSVGYNVDQIVSVNVSTNPQRKLDITEEHTDVDVSFSYR